MERGKVDMKNITIGENLADMMIKPILLVKLKLRCNSIGACRESVLARALGEPVWLLNTLNWLVNVGSS